MNYYTRERPRERIRAGADLVIGDTGRQDVAVLVERRPGGEWALILIVRRFRVGRVFSHDQVDVENLPEVAAAATRGMLKAADNHLNTRRPL